MPKVEVPLVEFDSVPKLKKLKDLVAERVRLYREGKEAERRLKGSEEDGPGLNFQLYTKLVSAMPAGVKSFEFTDADGSKFRVSLVASEKGQMRLDVPTLLTTPFDVVCQHCRKKTKTTVPADVVEGSKKEGKVPEPTVSVTPVEVGK